MVNASPTTYGLLGMLAVRSWTGYELTGQLQRSLRFVWPSSAGHLYREQRKLVELGWARVARERSGGRARNRYSITPEGEAALRAWLATTPEEPRFEIEGMLRLFHADHGTADDLTAALRATAADATAMLGELAGFAEEYLQEGGPLWALEHGAGGPGERIEWRGRVIYPERLPVIALVIDGTARLLDTLVDFATSTAAEARGWASTTDPALTAATRARLEAVRERYRRGP
jgi:PadR family transcriptional regulator, regulatory protein AphA